MTKSKWLKFNLDDFAIAKNGKPYLYSYLKADKGLERTKVATFFRCKIIGKIVLVPRWNVEKLTKDNGLFTCEFPKEIKSVPRYY